MSADEIKAMPWSLWQRQMAGVLRLELKRTFLSKRAWWIYLLALGPVVMMGLHSLIPGRGGKWHCTLGEDSMIYAGVFQFFFLKGSIFFGCVGIFSHLFRGEILEKTIHYYFLAPIRREVLLAAKYLAGLAAAVVFFVGSAAASFLLISAHAGQEYRDYILQGPGLSQFSWYVTIALLACIGYGAVFTFMGMVFRNPMFPATVVMIWENINGFLPAALKKLSVVFYLKSLVPVDVPLKGVMSLIAVDAEPAPAWIAVPGLLVVSAAILYLAARRVNQLEVSYSD